MPLDYKNRFSALWLFLCAAMVLIMAVIGAVTRLTESGLSIVEWRPYIGVLPPLSQNEWQRVFALYQQTPEFHFKNFAMNLEQFKHIYFWEWLHRLWGQLISFVYAVPLLWFWVRGQIPQQLKPKLLGILVLGALQGVMGWYMVKSGLVDRPEVSHYRLASHLLLALALYISLIWVGLENLNLFTLASSTQKKGNLVSYIPPSSLERGAKSRVGGLKSHTFLALLFLIITLTWGAFVAGLDAEFAYNTFPLMGGHWIPAEVTTLQPLWLNALENTAAVQWIHRWLALSTATVILSLALRLWPWNQKLSLTLASLVLLQVTLGITTLLLVVPTPIAAAHQAGAFLLIGTVVFVLYRQRIIS